MINDFRFFSISWRNKAIEDNTRMSKGLFISGALARLGGLAHLGEMIFIPRSYGIYCPSSIKTFVVSLEKGYLIKDFYNK